MNWNVRSTLKGVSVVLGAGLMFATLGTAMPASAETIIDEWAKVKTPAPPELKPVTIDDKTTALLVLDFNGAQDPTKGPCNSKTKPRCLASLPKMQTLIAAARDKGVPIVYSITNNAAPGDIATALMPKDGDPIVKSGPDKFVNTDLEKILDEKGIKTVIVTGTASEGAVLNTASHAALIKGMNIIVPVDGMSSTEPYGEQYVAWHLTNAPGISAKTTLTAIDMIKF
jgi:nicotinamidase-related amidase